MYLFQQYHINKLMMAFLILFFAGEVCSAEYISYGKPVKYKIRHTISVTNHDVDSLSTLEMALPIPTNWPEIAIRDVRSPKAECVVLTNSEGPGKIVRSFYDSNLPKDGQARSVKLEYVAIVSEVKANKALLEKTEYPKYKLNDAYKYYTRYEPQLECNDILIKNVADDIRQKTTNPYKFARLAYEYVTGNITYASPSPSHTAKECLSMKKGDCGPQSGLFVAICRAGGIPARPVAGSWCNGDNQWHCWAEFMLPGVGWIPADPSVGSRGPKEKEYYFGNLDNNHLPLMKCFNSKYDCTKGAKECGFIQIGYWYWFCSGPSKGNNITCEFKIHGERLKD